MLNLNQPQGSVGTSPGLDGTGLTNPDNWRSLLGVTSTSDARRHSLIGGQPGVTFDGQTSGTRISSALTGQAIAAGDFSVWTRFRCPASIPASGNGSLPGIWALTDTATATYRPNAVLLYLDNANQLRLFRYGANQATDNRIATISSFVTTYAGQVVDVVVTRTGNTLKIYVNGTDTAFSEATAGTPPTWGAAVADGFFNLGMQSSSNIFGDRIYRAVLFNRALSQSDVNDLIVNGVADADQWGTQTQVINASTLNGGFETAGGGGADVFASVSEFTSGTGALSRDTVTFNSGAASCRIQPGASGSAAVYWTAGTLPIGKRFRLTFTAKAASGTPALNVADVNSSVTFANQALTTSWAPYSLEAVNTGTGTSPKLTVSAANADVNLDLVVLERIGALVDLNLGEGAGLCFTDRSSNLLHGIGVGGVAHVVPGREGCVRVRTTAGGGIQLGGSVPVIPLNARIRCITADAVSGTPTVTMGSGSGGTQHVASVALAAGLNDLTVVNRFNTTGNLWVNVSVTATVDWTVIYDLVD
jgi:hypothetical protein